MDFFIVKGLKKITGSSVFTKHQKSENTMKVKYDKEVDILYIGLSEEKIKRER